jgi:uncharacterized protein
MKIEHIKNIHSGTFNVIENADTIGEITYFFGDSDESVMIVNHTWVHPSSRGKGYSEALVVKIIEFARENNLKINPTCSYVDHYLKKHPEYADLLA